MRYLLLLALVACSHSHPRPPLTEAAIAVPIRAGKTDDWKRALEELTGPRYAEYQSSRTRFGLTSQTTFVQRTPMGDFALIHLTGPDVHKAFHAMSSSQDPWDVQWRKMTLDLHGQDFARTKPPEVEPLFQTSADEPAAGQMFMFVAPVDPAHVGELRQAAAAINGPRHADYVAARAALGIHREAVFLETSGIGTGLVVYWRADDPVASLRALAAAKDPFDAWLAGVAGHVHPIPVDQLVAIASANQLVATYPHP